MDNVNLVHVIFDRTAQAPNEDMALFTLHIRGIVDNLPDSLGSITNGDRDAFATTVQSFWDTIKVNVSTMVKLVQIRFYELGEDLQTDMGPPVYVKTYNSAGASSFQIMPPQMAMSVTLKHPSTGGVGRTGSRWGRFYIPGWTAGAFAGTGRFDSTFIGTVANKAVELYRPSGGVNGCKGTIWSRKAWAHFDPNVIQVDDVPDVVRSRRFSSTNTRAKVTV